MFKTNIKQIRKEKGISQLELARRAKISPADVNQIENGKKYAFSGWRKRIAEVLDVDEEKLFLEESDFNDK